MKRLGTPELGISDGEMEYFVGIGWLADEDEYKKYRCIHQYTDIPEDVDRLVPTYGLFGDFHTLHCWEGVCVTFKAENPHRAIRKYFRYYCRKYKQHHRFAFDCLTEVSEKWGKLKVKDVNSGFVYYFG